MARKRHNMRLLSKISTLAKMLNPIEQGDADAVQAILDSKLKKAEAEDVAKTDTKPRSKRRNTRTA